VPEEDGEVSPAPRACACIWLACARRHSPRASCDSHPLATGPSPSQATPVPSRRRDGNCGVSGKVRAARGEPGSLWAGSRDGRSPGCEATVLAEVAGCGGAGAPATPAPPWSIYEPPGY
jgi:hypothetical protein